MAEIKWNEMTQKGHIIDINIEQGGKLSNESIKLHHDDLLGVNFWEK